MRGVDITGLPPAGHLAGVVVVIPLLPQRDVDLALLALLLALARAADQAGERRRVLGGGRGRRRRPLARAPPLVVELVEDVRRCGRPVRGACWRGKAGVRAVAGAGRGGGGGGRMAVRA